MVDAHHGSSRPVGATDRESIDGETVAGVAGLPSSLPTDQIDSRTAPIGAFLGAERLRVAIGGRGLHVRVDHADRGLTYRPRKAVESAPDGSKGRAPGTTAGETSLTKPTRTARHGSTTKPPVSNPLPLCRRAGGYIVATIQPRDGEAGR